MIIILGCCSNGGITHQTYFYDDYHHRSLSFASHEWRSSDCIIDGIWSTMNMAFSKSLVSVQMSLILFLISSQKLNAKALYGVFCVFWLNTQLMDFWRHFDESPFILSLAIVLGWPEAELISHKHWQNVTDCQQTRCQWHLYVCANYVWEGPASRPSLGCVSSILAHQINALGEICQN